MNEAAIHPDIDQIWAWLSGIPDPEIPVLSISDLGIVRGVEWSAADPGLCLVTITPTYSGCPAVDVIADQIRSTLLRHGIPRVALRTQLAPAWTTDWMSDAGRTRLREYGIAPPSDRGPASASPLFDLVQIGTPLAPTPVACPHCGSTNTQSLSDFGSTPCKSLHRCLSCLEPFDYFKAH